MGVVYILSNFQDGKVRSVDFFSKILESCETKYRILGISR